MKHAHGALTFVEAFDGIWRSRVIKSQEQQAVFISIIPIPQVHNAYRIDSICPYTCYRISFAAPFIPALHLTLWFISIHVAESMIPFWTLFPFGMDFTIILDIAEPTDKKSSSASGYYRTFKVDFSVRPPSPFLAFLRKHETLKTYKELL